MARSVEDLKKAVLQSMENCEWEDARQLASQILDIDPQNFYGLTATQAACLEIADLAVGETHRRWVIQKALSANRVLRQIDTR